MVTHTPGLRLSDEGDVVLEAGRASDRLAPAMRSHTTTSKADGSANSTRRRVRVGDAGLGVVEDQRPGGPEPSASAGSVRRVGASDRTNVVTSAPSEPNSALAEDPAGPSPASRTRRPARKPADAAHGDGATAGGTLARSASGMATGPSAVGSRTVPVARQVVIPRWLHALDGHVHLGRRRGPTHGDDRSRDAVGVAEIVELHHGGRQLPQPSVVAHPVGRRGAPSSWSAWRRSRRPPGGRGAGPRRLPSGSAGRCRGSRTRWADRTSGCACGSCRRPFRCRRRIRPSRWRRGR